MRNSLGKRILSLTLALELICAPVAMAKAEDPTLERREVPRGEEVSATRTQTGDLPVSIDVPEADVPQADTPAQAPSTAIGASSDRNDADITEADPPVAQLQAVDPDINIFHMGLGFGQAVTGSANPSITRYGGYFRQESALSDWGSSGGVSSWDARSMALMDEKLYFMLPDMGRVPGMELEGFYLTKAVDNTISPGMPLPEWVGSDTVRNWVYDEAHPENYQRLSLTTATEAEADALAAAGLTLSGTGTLVYIPESLITDDPTSGFVAYSPPDEDAGIGGHWSVPIVARWVPSSDSDMAMFAIDVTGTYPAAGGGTEKRSETVTDLYTKPFREAGSGDHILANAYQAEYLAQTEEEVANSRNHQETRTATVFTPDPSTAEDRTHKFYLRVEEEQDTLTLRFLTQEPGYAYHIGNQSVPEGEEKTPCPVEVSATFAGKSTVELPYTLSAQWDGDGQPFFPRSLVYGTTRTAQNNVDLPARGQWTVADIPLKKVSEAKDAHVDPFNTITVTITAPDGTQSTYIFYVERLMTPEITLGCGNTPAGMILRDDSTAWENTVEWGSSAAAGVDPNTDRVGYNKASALNYFKTNRTFTDMPIKPAGSRNQQGAIYMGEYNSVVWNGLSGNPDLDSAAIVAYQDAAFDDPGVSFVDSEGRKVVFGSGDGVEQGYAECVTRKLELRSELTLTVDSYADGGQQCWYINDANGQPKLVYNESEATQILRNADGSDPVDLRGLNVVPGVYTAVYTFEDPVSDDVLEARRTVVVLPIPGDVDMDGAVTTADAAELDANAAAWAAGSGIRFQLLRNRIYGMGVGPQGSRTYLNAAAIRQGFQPIRGDSEAVGYSDYMYLPLTFTAPADDVYHARKTWQEVGAGSGGAKLRLDYLGTEQGVWNKANGEVYTNGISGPWASPKDQGVSIVAGSPVTGTGDVFWMGVYVEDPGDMSGRAIQELSVSLVYDSEYVRPAVLYAMNEWNDGNYASQEACWKTTTLMRYNLRGGSFDKDNAPMTLFAGKTGDQYTLDNSDFDRPYTTHYSKVEGDLELDYTDGFGQFDATKLKEVVFSLQAKSSQNLAAMGEGYLLVVPFQLIRHPSSRMVGGNERAQLVELAGGMRDFNVVLSGSAQSRQGLFDLFSAEPRAAAGSTYAFSAQDSIYGDATQNIRDNLTYAYDYAGGVPAQDSLVPIGEDNTVRTLLTTTDGKNAVYDTPFTVVRSAFTEGRVESGSLPDGLELDSTTMTISGTPTRAGVYDFTIKGVPYRIKVEKRTIHYRAEAARTFYGETEYRGASESRDPDARNFTFTYTRSDLSDRDLAYAENLSTWSNEAQGSAEELEQILGRDGAYVSPVFQARESDNMTPVGPKTNVGNYKIIVENTAEDTGVSSANYTLDYDAPASGTLSIQQRPVWLSHLNIGVVTEAKGSIYNDDTGRNISLTATEGEGQEILVLGFPDSLTPDADGVRYHNGNPLTGSARVEGDVLGLRYGVHFLQNDGDEAYERRQQTAGSQVLYHFYLERDKEERDLDVYWIDDVLRGERSGNYAFMSASGMLHKEQCDVRGTVVRRGVEAISITTYPDILQYEPGADQPNRVLSYGSTNGDHKNLYVTVTRGAGDGKHEVGSYVYDSPLLQPMELHYNWVSAADKELGSLPENEYNLVGTGWDPGDQNGNGKVDERPYNGTDIFTPDMDGYYLCVAVKKYEANPNEGDNPRYIKVYSDHPIRVNKMTIVLTPKPLTRFYGEGNGALEYTYDITGMVDADQDAIEVMAAQEGHTAPTLTGRELERYFRDVLQDENFQAPVLEASKVRGIPKNEAEREANKVDANTSVGGGQYYILLYGGSSTNYDFAFSRPRESGSGSEIVSGPGAFGVSILTMMQRPIVVSDVFSAKGTKADYETIYADTKNLYLTDQSAPRERVKFTLPTTTDTTTTFFRHGTGGRSTTLPLSFADRSENAVAVLTGDDVSLTYSVRFMCDLGHFRWSSFTNNYYSVEDLSALGGSAQKDVVVADMVLTGEDAGNYELVYKTSTAANRRAPSNTVAKNYPDPTNNGRSTQYLIHGTGLVTLRQIDSLILTSVGQVDYTYGDTYAPYAPNPATKTAMSLMVEYKTEVDERHANGDLENNVHEEPVVFSVSKATTSFAQRGFTIYYLKDGQTTDQAIALNQVLTHESDMLPGEHDGASIFITGQRRVGDPLVISQPSDQALDPPQTLKVAKRELTFTARDAHRYYGETRHVNVGGEDYTDPAAAGSTEFTFSFPMAELAQRDREELARLKGVSVDALPTEGSEEDLRLLALSSRAVGLPTPTYSPDPGPTAPVNGDNWGEYEIDITPKDMDNYKVTGEPGTLYVYPRPIRVNSVLSSAEDPVFTIYNQSSTPYMTTQMDTTRVVMQRANILNAAGQEVDSKVRTQLCSDNARRALPLTGDALVRQDGGVLDSLIFTVRLYFYPEEGSTWDLEAGTADYAKAQVEATFRSVSNTSVAKNYAVTNVTANEQTTQKFEGLWGAVKLRTIDEIFITGLPKTGDSAYGGTYTYGDILDLTGLEVLIRYKALQGTGETVSVKYLGADQFRGYGLYVNYWYPGDEIPGGHKVSYVYDDQGEAYKDATTTTDAEDALRKALPTAYRRADSGDHLTIAPTHDTQRFIGAAVDPSLSVPKEQQRPFAANGKYLIISAYQEGEKQAPAVPKIIGAPVIAPTNTGFSYENADEPIAIKVLPKQLRYTLSATDKTYDGTPRTAGTLTLTNVFDKLAQVKIEDYAYPGYDDQMIVQAVPTEETITDVVYVPMGAAYENHGTDYAASGYDPYRQAIDGGKVAFTTGSYQPNGQAPLETNGVITWADGYEWGKGLTFTFPNANVHYLEEGEEAPRAIGTQELADYWAKSQTHNTPSGQWDSYGTVCAMPVEVTGMALAGPDAANYTWATDGTEDHDTQVTMTTRAEDDQATGRSAAPYATIHKANRATIQTLAGQSAVLPYLEVDEHTNAVRLHYTQALSAMGDNNNILGTTDEFSDELHFEYALFYDKDGLLTQWGGWDGLQGYQDTTFFGGELVKVENPAGFVPDYTRLPDPIKDADSTAKRGQRYQWAELDTGVSTRVHRDTGETLEPLREDAGVIPDLDAYPGGAAGAESYRWYYDLYTWGGEGQARVALPRNTVFYPLVRLSETHNYNASGNLTGSNDVTAQQLDEAQKAMAKLDGANDTQEIITDAQQASANVFQAAEPMAEAARKVSKDRVLFDAALALAKRYPESGRPALGTAPAIKTFQQRFDILSTSKTRSADRSDNTDYVIRTLEDVCFTDTLSYPEEENMDAVLYNEPARYYGYYWDEDLTAAMEFGKEPPIDFDTEMTVILRRKSETGAGMVDVEWTYRPEDSNHTAQIYVKTSRGGGQTVRRLRIVPSAIYARLGDEPMQLTVVMDPELPSKRQLTWATTNASVATVDQRGVVTFRGEGVALITVTTENGRKAVAVVTVSPFLPFFQGMGTLFNFGYGGPWAWLDGTYAFRPKEGMTRGQLAELLNIFLDPKAQWQTTQELAYVDVTGREKYYDALKRLTGAGVITGIPGGCFAGDQLATRAEFAAMLSRMLELDAVDTRGMAHAFADVDENSTWAYAYIDALAKTGVIRGVGQGDFAPSRVITREETAAIIARLLTTQIDLDRADLLRPSDVAPENWSYSAVLRAVNTVIFPD